MARVLMVLTGAGALVMADGTTHPTGFWAEEVAASHQVLTTAGIDVGIATPGGVQPPPDRNSMTAPFTGYLDGIADQLATPLALADVSIDDYDAIHIPGGHGPMADLAVDADMSRLLRAANERGVVVAALCHGLAALLSTAQDGDFAFSGKRLTVFSNAEELGGGTGENTPYFVETRLRELGAVVEVGAPWSDTVVVDGTLITGQNPQSSVTTAERVVAALR
ncbi:type 1 glutamine amidotransferase domain-containing protein [Kibdelosporangium phytohabitans]|uniref:Thiamine biosynthesis protein ThiJ n=1 Tax=Kibdelosporangium phytohabitans TaxID=860235 RepID=A0A0N7F430_9PSEU|nr:type 1 glutamine amidotransferase domain-containing protein [Kibdelosporangium phytohabitans]ALG10287.1 thiamine biosynthesis protein ThiJ [Kibdelosporangium phytohabitans]MBE1461317.1 putative intracellular protease/amidase [Kibdelosporangium phytohabitans]